MERCAPYPLKFKRKLRGKIYYAVKLYDEYRKYKKIVTESKTKAVFTDPDASILKEMVTDPEESEAKDVPNESEVVTVPDKCPICLEKMVKYDLSDDRVVILCDAEHKFHFSCVDPMD